jgi:hypothetical protein
MTNIDHLEAIAVPSQKPLPGGVVAAPGADDQLLGVGRREI